MEMTKETMQHIDKQNDLHRNIRACLESKDNSVLWLILGSIQVSLLFEEKELLLHYMEFNKLLKTLHTCYKHDLKDLLESVSETDRTDLLEWSSCIEEIYKARGNEKLVPVGFDTSKSGKHFCL